MMEFLARNAIVGVFVLMFVVAATGTLLVRKLTPYMDSRSWTVKRWSFILLMAAQAHGIAKTIWSDHHFNWHDVGYFSELLLVYIGLDVSYLLLLKDWQRFPYIRSSKQKKEKKGQKE